METDFGFVFSTSLHEHNNMQKMAPGSFYAINQHHFYQGIDGARVEKILDMASITLNKNSVPGEIVATIFCHVLSYYVVCLPFFFNQSKLQKGDKSALVPGGIRIGSPAMTTRGFREKEFELIADYIHEGVQITLEAKSQAPGSKLQDFMEFVLSSEFPLVDKVSGLRGRVEALSTQYPIPGVQVLEMRANNKQVREILGQNLPVMIVNKFHDSVVCQCIFYIESI